MMVTFVKLPKLTWTMEEGLVGAWRKNEGDDVQKGETICEIETEKTTDEIQAPEAGVLRKIVVPAGTSVAVNKVIAVIAAPNETLSDLDALIASAEKEVEEPKPVEAKVEEPVPVIVTKKRVIASPAARRLAKEQGINLEQVRGTGPGGRIVKKDVLKTIEVGVVQPTVISPVTKAKTIPITGMRKVISDRLTYSAKTALHVPITTEVDMTETVGLVAKIRPIIEEKENVRLSYTGVLVKAVAKSLAEHPIANSRIEKEQITLLEEINVGVAVALEAGLIVPVIRNANTKSLIEISANLRSLIDKAKQGTLATREASEGTFTISNLGMFGIDFFAPIINPPECAILGVGRIVKKPIVINDVIKVRSMMTLTLVFDHRIMDGAVAANFLRTIKQTLEKPYTYIVGVI